jgi:hypothetical protein
LRTTTRSSSRAVIGLAALTLLSACAKPNSAEVLLQLSPESPAHKAIQTRFFESPNETELLSASAAVLQDLGFQISESVRELGFLRAAKERSAREYGQEISRFLIALLTAAGRNMVITPVDLHQQINASLVMRPLSADGSRQEVRILFYRLVWKGDGTSGNQPILPGEQRMEMIRDPEIYQQFFTRLSKAVFLEAHKI